MNVVARSCRTCHISSADSVGHANLTFGTFDQLFKNRFIAYMRACSDHSMPNAEQSLKQFWASPARAHLLNRLSIVDPTCNVTPRASRPAGANLSASTAALLERYTADSCNCTTGECLTAVDDQYLREVAITPLSGGSDPGSPDCLPMRCSAASASAIRGAPAAS